MKFILFAFITIFFFLKSSQEQEEEDFNASLCYPTPDGFKYAASVPSEYRQKCKELSFSDDLKVTQREFTCCEVSMKKKSGSGVDSINGCIAVMKSYIDDDRYEDMIDYFERGKQYKLQNYFVMLGNSSFYSFYHTYLPMVNGTKYDVNQFDCFSEYKWINIALILAILFFIY